MNNIRTKRISLRPAKNNTTSQEDQKLYAVKKAAERVGNRPANIDENNVDTLSVLFFEDLGCSIELCKEDYSFARQAMSGEGGFIFEEGATKSFENQDDPFYEPDCGKKKPKQNKKREEETQQQAEMTFDLLVDISEETEQVTGTTQEVLQSVQRESDFTASTGLGATAMNTTGLGGTTSFQGSTRNTTSTSTGTRDRFYKLNG